MSSNFKQMLGAYMGSSWTFSKVLKEDNNIYVALFLNADPENIPDRMAVGINKRTGKKSESYFDIDEVIQDITK